MNRLYITLFFNIVAGIVQTFIKLTRDTHLMQQFIYYYRQLYMFRASICPSSGVLGCIRIILLHTQLTPVNKTTHRLLRTSATTPSAGHHME